MGYGFCLWTKWVLGFVCGLNGFLGFICGLNGFYLHADWILSLYMDWAYLYVDRIQGLNFFYFDLGTKEVSFILN